MGAYHANSFLNLNGDFQTMKLNIRYICLFQINFTILASGFVAHFTKSNDEINVIAVFAGIFYLQRGGK